ncbi:MAG: class I SAM-dependent methyltransferase [Clostridia bacterium]|nr:class I SAM-dependent methyltransferase [Clostridia bacterium]
MTGGYRTLAPVYDRLNSTVDYAAWADYIEKRFLAVMGRKPCSVLELGCGTGSMTVELARRGYDMTALDLSDDMLSEADRKARAEGLTSILFLSGDMRDFELYGTVEAAVCCLDGLNHLTGRGELDDCFALVSNYLEPGGAFVFDLNTPYRFRTTYADRDYVIEEDGALCCFRSRVSKSGTTADFYLTVFEEKNGVWLRSDGVEREKAFGLKAVKNALERNGLLLASVTDCYTDAAPTSMTERWTLTAVKA